MYTLHISFTVFFFQAEDGIRDLVRSRGLGDVYKRQQVLNLLRQFDSKKMNAYPVSDLINTPGINEAALILSLIHI